MRIVIGGAGDIGSHLAKMLRNSSNDVTVIDEDENRLGKLVSSTDVNSVEGSPASISILKKAGVGKADLFVAVYPMEKQDINVLSAILSKKLGSKRVIARINDEDCLSSENKLMFKELGVDLLFYPESLASEQVFSSLKYSNSSETMDFAHGKLQVVSYRIDEESEVLDMNLLEVSAMMGSESAKWRFIAIIRGGNTIVPKPDTKFMYHDLVYVISCREGMPSLMRLFGESSIEVRNVMIYGGTDISRILAREISPTVDQVKIIEKDRERCLELSEELDEKVTVSWGDGRNTDFLLDEGIKDCDAFIALTASDETNVLSCVAAKKLGVARTVAEVENIEYMSLAEEMGVDMVLNKKLITAGKIFRMTLSSQAKSIRYVSGTNAEILEYTTAPESRICGTPLKDVDFPQDAVIGGIIRGSDSFIAVGSTVIEPYDRVVVFALSDVSSKVDSFFK